MVHQGQGDTPRRIEYATRDIIIREGENASKRLNDKAANAYLSFVLQHANATLVSSPVCAFMKLLEEHVRQDKTLGKKLQLAYTECKIIWYELPGTEKEKERRVQAILDTATFNYFRPLVERMREYVGADEEDTWTNSVLEKLRANQRTPLLVKYYFSNLAQKKYLDMFNETQELKEELKNVGAFNTKHKQQQPTVLDRLFDNLSVKQSAHSKPKMLSNGNVEDFNKIVRSMVVTHERGGVKKNLPQKISGCAAPQTN